MNTKLAFTVFFLVLLLFRCETSKDIIMPSDVAIQPSNIQLDLGQVQDEYEVIPLGFSGYAYDINDASKILITSGGGVYIWDKGIITYIGSGEAKAINNLGQVAGWDNPGAWVWTNNVKTYLGVDGEPFDINDLGQVVGRNYLWYNGVVTHFDFTPQSINNYGQIVGFGFPPTANPQAVLWENGNATILPSLVEPGEWDNFATSINDAGQIIGWSWPGYPRSWVWNNGVLTELYPLPGVISCTAVKVNNLGLVVGASSSDGGHSAWQACYWNNGAVIELPCSASSITSNALGENDYGQIVGTDWQLGAVLWNPIGEIVNIDIKPGSNPNTINIGSNGTIRVAILSSVNFDATQVDPISVTLSDAAVKVKGNGTAMSSFDDINNDGLMDLVVHVETQGLSLTQGDIKAMLRGITFQGVKIRGIDQIRIVP